MILFDYESALERFMGEKDILIEVLPSYLENVKNNLVELDKLDPQTECKRIREVAHSIKGSSLNLDIIPLGREAEKLENLAYNNTPKGIPESIKKLKDLAAQTEDELNKYL